MDKRIIIKVVEREIIEKSESTRNMHITPIFHSITLFNIALMGLNVNNLHFDYPKY